MVSGERGMNPVVMTIINPWKEFVQAGGRTSDLLIASPRRYGQSHRASTLIHFSGQGYQRSNPRSVLINHSQAHVLINHSQEHVLINHFQEHVLINHSQEHVLINHSQAHVLINQPFSRTFYVFYPQDFAT